MQYMYVHCAVLLVLEVYTHCKCGLFKFFRNSCKYTFKSTPGSREFITCVYFIRHVSMKIDVLLSKREC